MKIEITGKSAREIKVGDVLIIKNTKNDKLEGRLICKITDKFRAINTSTGECGFSANTLEEIILWYKRQSNTYTLQGLALNPSITVAEIEKI